MIRIINDSGQVVKQINIQQQQKINVCIRGSGVYFVQLITGKKVVTKKLVVTN